MDSRGNDITKIAVFIKWQKVVAIGTPRVAKAGQYQARLI